MPRNGSGVYSLPSGNPVVAGTTIEASWANSTLDDLGTAMTNSLSRNGEGAMLAPLRIVDGTMGAPALAFATETGSGFYRSGTTTYRASVNGSDVFEFNASGVSVPSGKSLSVAGTFSLTGDQVQVSEGGTGATTAANARINLLPSYTSNALKVLRLNSGATDVEWAAAASGDVVGPASATNSAIVLFDGTTGKLIKDSATTLPTGALVGTSDTQTLTNKTLTNPTVTNYVETPYTANTGTAITLDLANGTVQILTLTGNATITMPTAVSGKSFIMYLKQDATGSRTVTWTTVKWPGGTAPTVTSTASKQDIYSFFSDGTNWYGVTVGQNYTP